jgi:hypothetical protein
MRRLSVSFGLAAGLLAAGLAVGLGCRPGAGPTTAPAGADGPAGPTPGLPWFVDATPESRIDFQHFNPLEPMEYTQETMGSGVGWIDYDNDGWLDLFCVQDGPVRPDGSAGTLPGNKLYRNNGDGTFTDVTAQVGLERSGYGMGCAVGDYDNDGFDDLVVTYFGGLVLYHNEPDGHGGRHFVDVTAKAGLSDPHFATSCAWGDVDGDGLLDLYVCNYADIDIDHYTPCQDPAVQKRFICPPTVFPLTTHLLFHNNGDGTFSDWSSRSGIASAPPAPGLAVATADLDGDGRLDIYVANDMKPAYLFHNLGGGRFEEVALLHGCALMPNGRFIAGMGISVGDVDGSGRPSLFVSNFQNEPNMLFLNRGDLFFQEWSYPSGLGAPSVPFLAFGNVFCDFNLDGILDVAVANGHVIPNAEELYRQPYTQEAQLFVGDGKARFRDVSRQAGAYFRRKLIGRGLAWADYNNDGLPDLAYAHCGGPLVLLRNATATGNHWVRLELVGDGKKSNRNAVGARVEVEAGGTRQVRFIHGGGSYLSASDQRQLVGLGPAESVERVTVVWPSGGKQEFTNLAAGRWWRLHEGKDEPESVTPRRPAGTGGP